MSQRRNSILLLLLLLLCTTTISQAQEQYVDVEEEEDQLPAAFHKHKDLMNQARAASKPSILLPATILGTTLPISPITLYIFIFTVLFCIYIFQRTSKALTYHILIEGGDGDGDEEEETRKTLLRYKEEIGNNERKFCKYAEMYSVCPSGKRQMGNLGWVPQGSMVQPFDKVVFDVGNEVGVCLGPVKTEFGWHLIWIKERVIRSW